MSKGLTGYSTTGVWIAMSGDRMIGPFDGRTQAVTFRREAKQLGYTVTIHKLWTAHHAREAMRVRNRMR